MTLPLVPLRSLGLRRRRCRPRRGDSRVVRWRWLELVLVGWRLGAWRRRRRNIDRAGAEQARYLRAARRQGRAPAALHPRSAPAAAEGGGLPAHVPGEADLHPGSGVEQGITDGVYEDGAPIGGFGAGTITWQFDGRFCWGRLDIGSNDQNVDNNAGFFSVPEGRGGRRADKRLDKTAWAGAGDDRPRSFRARGSITSERHSCKAKVEQYSPIIPGDYKKTSYPVGVHRWEITESDRSALRRRRDADREERSRRQWRHGCKPPAMTSAWSPRGGGRRTPRDRASSRSPAGTRRALSSRTSPPTASPLRERARLRRHARQHDGRSLVRAIAFQATVEPGKSAIVPIVLAWDIPVTQAGSGDRWYRAYTRHFGRTGSASWTIAAEALAEHEPWPGRSRTGRRGVLDDPKYPEWLKGALFNELWYYAIGGTYWEAGAASGQPHDPDEDMFTSLGVAHPPVLRDVGRALLPAHGPCSRSGRTSTSRRCGSSATA